MSEFEFEFEFEFVISIFFTGIVTYVDNKEKSCTVSFDTDKISPVGNVPYAKIEYYLQQSVFLSSIGPINRIIAKFHADKSLFTVDVYACLTHKYDLNPVVPAYEFDAEVFNFAGIPVGDCLSLEKTILEETCLHLNLEIAAKDDTNYYVSVFLLSFCFSYIVKSSIFTDQVQIPCFWSKSMGASGGLVVHKDPHQRLPDITVSVSCL